MAPSPWWLLGISIGVAAARVLVEITTLGRRYPGLRRFLAGAMGERPSLPVDHPADRPCTCKELSPIPGYSNRVLHLKFPELTEDYATDPIWVAIRNPQLQPPEVLRPKDIALDAEGKPVNEADAMKAMYDMISALIIGMRVYDATVTDIKIGEDGELADDQPEQPLLKLPATPDVVRRLPMQIITRISQEVSNSANPR